ncbi:MAG: antibiotic biosynthesis monooxygenase [Pseudomonadota bacterium]
MADSNITVVYKWTAKKGMLSALTDIYKGVTDAMEANEPGALDVQVYASEADNALYVRDEFADADALGFHLSQTAAPHFPKLLEVATPGSFLFFGDVPAPMQEAAKQMGLAAEFASHQVGFQR